MLSGVILSVEFAIFIYFDKIWQYNFQKLCSDMKIDVVNLWNLFYKKKLFLIFFNQSLSNDWLYSDKKVFFNQTFFFQNIQVNYKINT
jgi:hypothetical protein